MGSIHEPVHRGVDAGGRTARAVQAVVKRRDHLVFALEARVDVHESAHAVEPQHGEPLFGQRTEVAAGALHPQQLDLLTRDGVGLGALRRGVAPRVVADVGLGAEAVRTGDEIGLGSLRSLWSHDGSGTFELVGQIEDGCQAACGLIGATFETDEEAGHLGLPCPGLGACGE